MDDKALEELCKWHDEQAAMLRSEAGNLAAAAVAADMHAKTSAALHEAATEIKQLRLEAGLSASDPPAKTSDRSISNIPAPIFWFAGGGSGRIPGLVDSRDAGLAISRADPQSI
jgi:hypothetical protein